MRTTRPLPGWMSALATTILLGLTAAVGAAEQVKFSGVIVSISDSRGTFVLAEVGPWRVRDGATVITRRTIALAPDTAYAVVGRAETAPSAFPGDFVETPVGPDRIHLNDWVTVECRREGGRLVAVKITAVDLSRTEAPGGTPR